MSVLNDLMFGLTGYVMGHLMSCDYIYKHRIYVRERIYFEQTRQIYDRSKLKPTPQMLPEYPFVNDLMSDAAIISDRVHPVEVV